MTYPLLPKLERVQFEAVPLAQWGFQSLQILQDVAQNLCNPIEEGDEISSVPTIWARPLTMEIALHTEVDHPHPVRERAVDEWQGMLAAVALAEVYDFPLRVELVDLTAEQDNFARTLEDLLPKSSSNFLYDLPGTEDGNPWRKVYVFLWKGCAVGMTSPSTLVCPAEDGDWSGLPWWNGEDGLLSPLNTQGFTQTYGKLLWFWLNNLKENLRQSIEPQPSRRPSITRIIGHINKFQDDLREKFGEAANAKPSFSEDAAFFGTAIVDGSLKVLNRPIKALAFPDLVSNVEIMIDGDRDSHYLLVDPEIPQKWDVSPYEVWIYSGTNFGVLQNEEGEINFEKLDPLRSRWNKKKGIRVLTKEDLFLEKFHYVSPDNVNEEDSSDELFPGIHSLKGEPLSFQEKTIIPFIPVNSILFDLFSPEFLVDKVIEVKYIPARQGESDKVEVTLNLPLRGLAQDSRNYRLSKVFTVESDRGLGELNLPMICVWPNFKFEDWRKYYVFYYACHAEQDFKIEVPSCSYVHDYRQSESEGFDTRLYGLEKFPTHLICRNRDSQDLLGIILLKPASSLRKPTEKDWIIGVDFGTSFTNVYVKESTGTPNPLPLESLLLKITSFDIVEQASLFDYFIPETFIPNNQLPLSSVLTTRGSQSNASDRVPVRDGRIYIPDMSSDLKSSNFVTDLKWRLGEGGRPTSNCKLFLWHLVLHISAIAAKSGVTSIHWSVSYPLAFSKSERNEFSKIWQKILTESIRECGSIEHKFSDEGSDLQHFLPESLAIASYFRTQEACSLESEVLLDIGGGTSDISIWRNGKLAHQCSIQFAGRDFCLQFLYDHPSLRELILGNEISFDKSLDRDSFNARLSSVIRLKDLERSDWFSERWSEVQDEPEFQALEQLMSVGIAGICYYIYVILKALEPNAPEESEPAPRSRPTSIYIGGNGSRLLNWASGEGKFSRESELNELIAKMVNCGNCSDIDSIEVKLSKKPKEEVAYGLVSSREGLPGSSQRYDYGNSRMIAGETCKLSYRDINNKQEHDRDIEWHGYLGVDYPIGTIVKSLQVEEIAKLKDFISDYHRVLRNGNMERIRPIGVWLEQGARLEENVLKSLQAKLNEMIQKSPDTADKIQWEPPFILGLKAFLKVLSSEMF